MKLKIFYITLFVCVFVNAQTSLNDLLKQHNNESIPYITTEELSTIQENVILLDARELHEYEVSHIKKAIHVGYDNFKIKAVTKENIPKDTTIVVYCSLGIRSEDISEKLKKKGYKNVLNLYGGIFEWKNSDQPLINAKGESTEEVHTFSKEWSKWLLKGKKVF